MGKLTPHPQAELIKAWADGNTIQMRHIDESEWEDTTEPRFGLTNQYDYRIKPRTININGFEVPEPFRGELGVLQEYFIVLIDVDVMRTRITAACNNSNLEVGRKYVALGIVHLTEEAAELHARALLSFTAKQGE